jgi:hypothetical protein
MEVAMQKTPAQPDLSAAVVTVTRVATPWYAPRWLLTRAFKRAVPEYQAIPGLLLKHFAIAEDGRTFGGIYLWESRAASDAWFTPAWFTRVKKSYGVDGVVDVYALGALTEHAPPQGTVGDFWMVLSSGQRAPAGPGLLRTFLLADGSGTQPLTLTLWQRRAAARDCLRQPNIQALSVFQTPVLLNNLAPATPARTGQATGATL